MVTDLKVSRPTPIVTIGMPVYNGEKYLRSALDSLLAQNFTDFELIISDNASTDMTAEICEEYSRRDARIKYILQPENIGIFRNFEYVIKAANAKYFMVACDDDLYDQAFLETLMSILRTDCLLDYAFSGFGYITPQGAKVPGVCGLRLTPQDSHCDGLAKFLFRRSALPIMMGVFRTEVLLKSLPFEADELAPMTGDVDNVFLVKALTYGRGVNTPEPLFYYRLKDRAGGLPDNWPRSSIGQILYIMRHQFKVVRLMHGVLRRSDFALIEKTQLVVLNWISAMLFFSRYLLSRMRI